MLWWSGTALVEVELLILEFQLRDIELRLTLAELDADLEVLCTKHCELAEDDPQVSQPVASNRPSQACRASLSGSFRSLSDNIRPLSAATSDATASARAPWPLACAGLRAPDRAHRTARVGPRAPGYPRRAALAGSRSPGLPVTDHARRTTRAGLHSPGRARRAYPCLAARARPHAPDSAPGPARGARHCAASPGARCGLGLPAAHI
jgi:hypothetical protein